MRNLISHAKLELGLIPSTDTYEKHIYDSVLELIDVFSKQGHSGCSANIVTNLFNQLSRFETISPLTGNDDEWVDVSDGLFQNYRDGRVFKDKDRAYFIDGLVWVDEKSSYTNHISKVTVKFPLIPKSFYIKVDDEGNILDREEVEKAKQYYQL